MVGVFALMLSLFYAMQVPLCLCVRVDTNAGQRVGWGIGAVSLTGARRRALRSSGELPAVPLRLEKQVWMKAAVRGADYLYVHRLLLRVQVDATLGGMDADWLALCWGAGTGLLEALSACTNGRVSGRLRADFSADATTAQVRLTYAAKAGVVLAAALRSVRDMMEEKVNAWISIPLKVS